jgi:hypothetical protein
VERIGFHPCTDVRKGPGKASAGECGERLAATTTSIICGQPIGAVTNGYLNSRVAVSRRLGHT